MRKLLLQLSLILCLLSSASLVYAVPAYPGFIDFKQPDGQIVKIRLYGDEFLHWASTEDNYTLLYDDEGYLAYAEKDAYNGNIVPSKIRPSATGKKRSPQEMQFLQKTGKGLTFSEEQISIARQALSVFNQGLMKRPSKAKSRQPLVGNMHFVTILIEYQDCHFRYTKEDFEKMFNQLNYHENGNYGSVRDFYLENSYGMLDLMTDVFGIYRARGDMKQYGYSGGNSYALITEAITMADNEVDFSKYDNDGDGVVEGVHVIFAGEGAEAGNRSNIWSHMSEVNIACDGVLLNRYCCTPEIFDNKINNIGVICHELGHVLGALDYYDTNYGSNGYYEGTGQWDVMAHGSWNGPGNNGACPPHFNPDVKVNVFGWTDALNGNVPSAFKLNAKDEKGIVRIDTHTDGEYFLAEYRCQTGFDRFIPGHGLMVYRASSFLKDYTDSFYNLVNITHPQGFYPLCAAATKELPTEDGGYGQISSDSTPFPGSLNVTEISDYGKPSMTSWAGAPTEKPITLICENVEGEFVTFDVAGGGEGVAYAFKVEDTDLNSVSLSWKSLDTKNFMVVYNSVYTFGSPDSKNYNSGESIPGGGTVIYSGTQFEYKHTGLEENSICYYKLYTQRSDGSWLQSGETYCKTVLGVIRKFPYIEDFEYRQLGENWKVEKLFPNSMDWEFIEIFDSDSPNSCSNGWSLISKKTDPQHQKTRLIMPPVDFTGKQSAILSFDYMNSISDMLVQYRTGPQDAWHTMDVIKSSYSIYSDQVGGNYHTSDLTHTHLKLQSLSSTYEISFVTEFDRPGSLVGKMDIILDNIRIDCDDYMSVVTGEAKPTKDGGITFSIDVLEGIRSANKYGVEYTFRSEDDPFFEGWNEIEFNGTYSGTLDKAGRMLWWRAFVEDAEGERVYGDTKIVAIGSFERFKGKGTEEDPFRLEDYDDFQQFISILQGNWSIIGYECENMVFSLESDIEGDVSHSYTGGYSPSCFEGIFYGNDHTIIMSGGIASILGQNGKIIGLNVIKPDYSTSAEIVSKNYGEIIGCTVKSENHDYQLQTTGGICKYNCGLIMDCHTQFDVNNEKIECGGICVYNSATIANCSYTGHMVGCHNSTVGGIAAYNASGDDFQYRPNGVIINCVNNGTIEFLTINSIRPFGNKLGGICGSNKGLIKSCANYGNLFSESKDTELPQYQLTDSYVYLGGISGDGGYISNCINYGDIHTDLLISTNQTYAAGGIAGLGSLSINGVANYGQVIIDGSDNGMINAVTGYNISQEMLSAYYAENANDDFASAIDNVNQTLSILNSDNQTMWGLDSDGRICLNSFKHRIFPSIGVISDFGCDYIRVPWGVSGENLSYGVLEYRRKGDFGWMPYDGERKANLSCIKGLSPKTVYEFRVKSVANDGTVLYSDIESPSTMFSTLGELGENHEIDNSDEFFAFAQMVAYGSHFSGMTVKLNCDVDLEGRNGKLWRPIKSYISDEYFKGDFNGNGHIVYDMKIHSSENYVGLFSLFDGVLQDLVVRGGEILVPNSKGQVGITGGISENVKKYPGVGGLVGGLGNFGMGRSLVERCGFEGRITVNGEKATGGIVGTDYLCDELDVKDCYVNGEIVYNNANPNYAVGGIVGNGDIGDCYFTGSVSWRDGTENAGSLFGYNYNKALVTYNYCSEGSSANTQNCGMPVAEMKTDAFIDKLTPDIWCLGGQLNEGFPVFASNRLSRISTQSAKHDEAGDVILTGLYSLGVSGSYETFGFEYFNNSTEQLLLKNVSATIDENITSATISIDEASPKGVEYRAYATNAAQDTIYGDWRHFYPTVFKPKVTLVDVKCMGTVLAFMYVIDRGSETLKSGRIVTTTVGDDNPSVIDIDLNSSDFITRFDGKVGDKYESYLEVFTESGMTVRSDLVTWTAGETLLGDSNVDFRISVDDVATTLNYILEIYPNRFNYDNADVNRDGNITITDATLITNIVMSGNYLAYTRPEDNMSKSSPYATLEIDDCSVEYGESVRMPLVLQNQIEITSIQCDIVLPDGVVLIDEPIITSRIKPTHSVMYNRLINGKYRFIIHSSSSEAFDGNNDTLFFLPLNVSEDCPLGELTVLLENIIMATPEGIEHTAVNKSALIDVYRLCNITVGTDNNFGHVEGSGSYRVGSKATIEATPNEGYHFVKWTNGSADNPYTFTVTEDVSLSAIFEPNNYTVTFMDGETVVYSAELPYNSVIEAPDDPIKEGYTFDGWYADEVRFTEGTTVPIGGITYYSVYSKNTYTLTFVIDGTVITETQLEYDAVITEPTTPQKEGYTFSGWSEHPQTMPAHDLTITGSYTVNSYTVTYLAKDEIVRIDKVDFGDTLPEAPIAPEFEGYIFIEWKDKPESMPAYDIVVEAIYEVVDGIMDVVIEPINLTVYDLFGRLINANMTPDEIKSLIPGVYIINHRKVLIK